MNEDTFVVFVLTGLGGIANMIDSITAGDRPVTEYQAQLLARLADRLKEASVRWQTRQTI
jgi:hypothetical protein